MLRVLSKVLMILSLLLTLTGCGKQEKVSLVKNENAVYHWKGYLHLEDSETEFLNAHNVNRMYVRLFDVRPDYRYGAVPDAEAYLSLGDLPAGTKIVPTVFITLEALEEMEGKEGELAANIYQLVVDMMKAQDVENFDELQIDCDWTELTRGSFFKLSRALRGLAHDDGRLVSATIRLHQLSQPAPPVDSGVLMVYNVGELQNVNETNSILRADIVKAYLTKAPKYSLPLDVAYPIFSWGAVFRGDKFNRLVRLTSPIDSVDGLKPLHDNIYQMVNPELSENILSDVHHETFRYESVSAETLREVKRMVEKYLGGRPHRVILYHLDESTISNYTPDEIDSIYE